jgi:hypothetical protein
MAVLDHNTSLHRALPSQVDSELVWGLQVLVSDVDYPWVSILNSWCFLVSLKDGWFCVCVVLNAAVVVLRWFVCSCVDQ